MSIKKKRSSASILDDWLFDGPVYLTIPEVDAAIAKWEAKPRSVNRSLHLEDAKYQRKILLITEELEAQPGYD